MPTMQTRTALVVLLTDLTVHGEHLPEKTVLEVERAIRNDWFGSKLCRDATADEVAEYRAQTEADGDELDAALADLQAMHADIADAQQRRTELAAEIEAAEQALGELREAITQATAELAELDAKKAAATAAKGGNK